MVPVDEDAVERSQQEVNTSKATNREKLAREYADLAEEDHN